MNMEPLEAIVAATAGGARALRLEDGAGTLGAGAAADIVVWELERHEELPYRFGTPPIHGVWKRGVRVA
jgi:imidazolonepropionase